MIDELLFWIWLTELKNIGPVTQRKLLNRFVTPFKLYQAQRGDFEGIEGVGKRTVDGIFLSRSLEHSQSVLNQCQKENIGILTMEAEAFPRHLKDIYNAPVLFYYQGQLKAFNLGVLVLGDYEPDAYGKKATEEVVKSLVNEGAVIVGGLSKGTESQAHGMALDYGGFTIAVAGSGTDICYPATQKKLYRRMLQSGLILSPYPPGTKPFKSNLLKRLNWMVLMADRVVVVQASISSPSLKTARQAREYGKSVLVVPNDLFKRQGRGSNQLLAEGFTAWVGSGNQTGMTDIENHSTKGRIMKILEGEALPLEILKKRMKNSDIDSELMALEIEGRVQRIAGIIRKLP